MVRDRKVWSTDPNGEVWARDENKFGKKMLEKMGWSDGKGLGADLSGETSHVKVNKRAVHLGLGADAGTPDRWTEHISEFDDILSNLNTTKTASAPNSGPNSAVTSEQNSAVNSDQDEPAAPAVKETTGKRQKRKKAKDLYTKFKKHKNLGSLSNQDMAHIFGETKKESSESQKDGESSAGLPAQGLKTITSKMSMAEYFNSKKAAKSDSNKATEANEDASGFKFSFYSTPDKVQPVLPEAVLDTSSLIEGVHPSRKGFSTCTKEGLGDSNSQSKSDSKLKVKKRKRTRE